jgi:hypothetical protein
MNRLFITLSIGLLLFIGCKSTDKSKESNINTQSASINLYAFIGEKISVIEFDPNAIKINPNTGDTIQQRGYIMDFGFKAQYKVLGNIFNDLQTDTIDFIAYDHYGRPGFENHQYVMLYISKDKEDGVFYHQKYQYDALVKTRNGTWQGVKGKSIKALFEKKKNGVFKARQIF